jgi:gamma-glutamylcysteine synthetase
MYFHAHHEFGTFSSASQVQLDVKYDDIVKNIETFSLLEPIKAILFANSVFPEEDKELLCARDMLWENSTQGINPHNLGMYNRKFNEVEELLSYIETTSIYCVERGNKYINFPPVNIVDYLKSDSVTGEYYEDGQYKSISVTPRIEDLEYLRTFKFEDLTFRGTIEYRSACCQPIKDSMTVAAFHVGIKENLDKVHSLMVEDKVIYHRGYTESELRKMFTYSKYPTLVNEDELYNLVEQVVDMANEGLVSRGYGEEKMLEPLYDRIKKRTNPARNMLKRMAAKEPIESIIIDYGKNN